MYRDDAVKHFGGRRQLAEALGISHQAVAQWGKLVARGMAYRLQVMTKNALVVDEAKYKRKKKLQRAEKSL
jgi:DNA-binding transcriptional regulator YdaS (Cro superfamily)